MFTSTTTSEYSILECPPISSPLIMDRTTTKWKCTNIEIAPNCPRCASSNTKFCYYNNYSLSQPRYFCKGCRRYWTKGGSLRNVLGGRRRLQKESAARATRQGGGPNCSAPTLSPGSTNESESPTRIDMAAVFSQRSSFDSQIEDVTMFDQYQKVSMDLINDGDNNQIQQVIPQFSMHQEIDGQDFVYQDCNGFDQMQQGTMLGDELAGDVLWSEGTNLPNFGSQLVQPMVQVQDLGLFSPDDQFRISANLVADNWGSFDLSAYELFSTP
ncbi:hypothetical protein DH2020_047448 [Rehmannia glutinosa]|uniref:Dof zinc finger protein n=1 Tax=Rehmannia glutinosa TaxID=99300 RepID=A0ABR0U8J0_REHGL